MLALLLCDIHNQNNSLTEEKRLIRQEKEGRATSEANLSPSLITSL